MQYIIFTSKVRNSNIANIKSLALAIKFSFSFLRLASESFNFSILASKLTLSSLRLEIESSQTLESTLATSLAFSFLGWQ
jgi:hypothetical protein